MAVLSAVLAAAAFGRPAPGEPRWPWPLATDPQAITGTFMEPRQGGYHAGLDLRTEGRTGLPVRSPVDGWVARVRTSPRGYGKALYVRAADGRTLVFAHLSGFHAPVQERLRAAMARNGRYEQDLSLGAGEIPVRVGELIALSGESGTGAPHLHLEVRDAAGRPTNPALALAVPDTVAPTVESIRLVPLELGPGVRFPLDPIDVGARVAARGRFAVQVAVGDRTGFAPFGVAPYGVLLRVDGEEHYRAENDVFDFEQSSQIHLESETVEGRRFLRLQRRKGLDLPGRRGQDGSVVVGDRPVTLEVEVWDLAGRRGRARVVLDPAAAAPVRVAPLAVSVLHFAETFVAAVPATGREFRLDGRALEASVEDGLLLVPWTALGVGELELRSPGASPARRWIAPGGPGFEARTIAGTAVSIADPHARAVREGGVLVVEVLDRGAVPVPDGMRILGAPLRVRAVALAWREGYEVAAPVTRSAEHVAWMVRDRKGRWSALDTEIVAEAGAARATTRLREDGEIALAEDHSDPTIAVPAAAARVLRARPTTDAHGLPRPRWPELRIAIEDRGAGMGDRSPEVRLDGRPHPAVWDPERGELVFDWFVDPGEGVHAIEIVAADRAGRSSVARFEVRLGR